MVIGSIGYSSEWNDLLKKKNQSRSFPKIYFNLSIYLRKNRTHCILIKTGKTEFIVPAALFLICPAVSGCCWVAAWQVPAGGCVSQSWVWTGNAAAAPALPVSSDTVNITSESDQEAKMSSYS